MVQRFALVKQRLDLISIPAILKSLNHPVYGAHNDHLKYVVACCGICEYT